MPTPFMLAAGDAIRKKTRQRIEVESASTWGVVVVVGKNLVGAELKLGLGVHEALR